MSGFRPGPATDSRSMLFSGGAKMLTGDFAVVKNQISILAGFNIGIDEARIYELLGKINSCIKDLKSPTDFDEMNRSINELKANVEEVSKAFKDIISKLQEAGARDNKPHFYQSTIRGIQDNLKLIEEDKTHAIKDAQKKMPEPRVKPQDPGTHSARL